MEDVIIVLVLSFVSTILSAVSFISSMWYSIERIRLEKRKMKWREEHPYPHIVKDMKTRRGVMLANEEDW
jgi:hypothetical protein